MNMWTCPKCGRTFQRTNQGHDCGKAPETVLEYIDRQAIEAHPHATEMMTILQNCVPGVKEYILWGMPYYEKDGKAVSFAANKNDISFYAGAAAIEKFAPELKEIAAKKNAIYFPYKKTLPANLVERIAKWCFS